LDFAGESCFFKVTAEGAIAQNRSGTQNCTIRYSTLESDPARIHRRGKATVGCQNLSGKKDRGAYDARLDGYVIHKAEIASPLLFFLKFT
jgi:hypothetical protein